MTGVDRLHAFAAMMPDGARYELLRIAKDIERETLPRPLFEDGTPVERGDIVLVDGEEARVNGFYVNYNGSFGLDAYVFESCMTIGKGYGSGERVKRSERDTWERLEYDVDTGRGFDGMDKAEAMAKVLRRCKALAGVK